MRAAALALGLALALAAVSPAEAKDCRGETPLPPNLPPVPPRPAVPAGRGEFRGGWSGTWTARGQEWECTVLVVEEVYANGYARGVFSVGMAEGGPGWAPTFFVVAG